jgi:predicted Zn-dependent peptidase
MEDIDAATLEDVASFFETFYVPNNAVITLAGDFDSGEALGLINQYFADIPRGADVPPLAKDPTVAPLIGETVRQVVVSDVPLPRVIMAFRIPPFSSDDFAVAEVAQALLGQGRAARLYRRLVRERRVAKSVVSYAFPLLSGASMLLVWATGYPGMEHQALEAAIAEEVEDLRNAETAEVERAIALTETDLVRGLERVSERADLLSAFELHFDDPDRVNRELDRLRAVSVDQIRAFADSHLGPDNRAVLIYDPKESS